VTFQLHHTACRFLDLYSIVSYLAFTRSISGFIALLLVNVKAFPQCFCVKLINLGSGHQVLQIRNLCGLRWVLMTLGLTYDVIGLSGRYLTIAKVIVVHSDVEMACVCATRWNWRSHVSGMLKQWMNEVLGRARTLFYYTRDEHRWRKIVRFQAPVVSPLFLSFVPTVVHHAISPIAVLKLVEMHFWVWRNRGTTSHMGQLILSHVLSWQNVVIGPHHVVTVVRDIVGRKEIVVRCLSVLTRIIVVLILVLISSPWLRTR